MQESAVRPAQSSVPRSSEDRKEVKSATWRCSQCGSENLAQYDRCGACSAARPERR